MLKWVREKTKIVRIAAAFRWLCLVWMLLSQAAGVVWLYYENWDCHYDEPILTRICPYLWELAIIGAPVLSMFGIVLVVVHAIKERRLGFNASWALSGIAYVVLGFIGAVLIGLSMPEDYDPPPGLEQFVSVGIVIALDTILLVAIRRFIRRHDTGVIPN